MRYCRVLLADHHLNILASLYGLLAGEFENVFMVADESSLLEAITRLQPALVVVDLSLPNTGKSSGASIVARLLEVQPQSRVVVLSVDDDPTVAASVCQTGTVGFVLKRTAGVDLPAAIHVVLQGGTFISPAVKCDHDPVE